MCLHDCLPYWHKNIHFYDYELNPIRLIKVLCLNEIKFNCIFPKSQHHALSTLYVLYSTQIWVEKTQNYSSFSKKLILNVGLKK